MAFARTADAQPLAHYRAEFPIFERQIYLESCSPGALSTRSRRRVQAIMDVWDSRGAAAWYDVWWEALVELRAGYAAVVGAQATEIALHASISTATSALAGILDYAKRPKVVITALDFPTVAYQWLSRARSGVEMIPHADPAGAVRRLAQARVVADARPGHVRLSPFFYNLQDDNVAAIEQLSAQ